MSDPYPGPGGWKIRLFLVSAIILSLATWRLVIVSGRPPLLRIADELGSIAQTKTGIYPDSDDSSLIYFLESETGLGAYLCETTNGRSHLLFEEKEKSHGGHFRMLGWSPDNSVLAYFTTSEADARSITLYDGHNGAVLAKIPATAYAPDSQFYWLSGNSFVYSTHDHRSWLVFAGDNFGKWTQTQVVKRFTNGRLANLTVTSPHSIAWLRNGEIWNFDFATERTEKLWENNDTNKAIAFACANGLDTLSIECTNKDGRRTLQYRPPDGISKTGKILEVKRPDKDAQPLDLDMSHGRYVFSIKPDRTGPASTFVWDGMLRYYALGGGSLFFTGNTPDGVPGVWQYDTRAKTVRCLVSGQGKEFKYARMTTPTQGSFTNKSGQTVTYHLWSPGGVGSGEKHPVILGQSLMSWNPCAQIAANGGYFYATSDLPDWINPVNTWADEVERLYHEVAKNPAIDTNRVFLIAYSAQAADISRMACANPGFYKGFILFRPAALPELAGSSPGSIFITSGTADEDCPVPGLLRFQDEAFKSGIPVNLSLQEGAEHVIRSIATEREESRQFALYLLENK